MAVEDVAPASGKMYSLTDVKQHNTEEDCWIVVHGKVKYTTALWKYMGSGTRHFVHRLSLSNITVSETRLYNDCCRYITLQSSWTSIQEVSTSS